MVASIFAATQFFNRSSALRTAYQSGQRARLLVVGDSNTAGWGANGAGGGAGVNAGNATNYLRTKSYVRETATLLIAAGYRVRSDGFFGSGASAANTIAEAVAANPSLAFGANWSVWTSNLFVGAYSFLCASSNTTTDMTYTPTVAADRFDIYFSTFIGGGIFRVADSGGNLQTGISTNAAESFQKVTVSRGVASTLAITLRQTTTGGLFIVGIVPWDSTSPRLELINAGYAGSKVSDWQDASHAYSPFLAVPIIDADAVSLNFGPNDAQAGVTPAQYQTNLQALITQFKPTGDILLIKPATSSDTHNPPAGYITAIDTLVANNSLAQAANFNSISMLAADRFDSVHFVSTGHVKMANVFEPVIASAIGNP